MIIRGKHIGSRLAWTVQRKFNPQFEDKDKRVEGLAIFHEWFRDHHILVSRTAEEYINGIFPRDRAIIAYTQNLMMWLALIRFEIITFFGKIKWVSVATANPFIFLDRGDLAAQTLAFLCAIGAFFGKLSSFELTNYYETIAIDVYQGTFMLYKSYTRTEQFTYVFRKLEFYETLELVPRYRFVFERRTKFFAIYIVNLVNSFTYALYLALMLVTFLIIMVWPTLTMLVSASIWLLLSIIMMRGLASMLLTCFFYVYMITLYLSLRYRHINETIALFTTQSEYLFT